MHTSVYIFDSILIKFCITFPWWCPSAQVIVLLLNLEDAYPLQLVSFDFLWNWVTTLSKQVGIYSWLEISFTSFLVASLSKVCLRFYCLFSRFSSKRNVVLFGQVKEKELKITVFMFFCIVKKERKRYTIPTGFLIDFLKWPSGSTPFSKQIESHLHSDKINYQKLLIILNKRYMLHECVIPGIGWRNKSFAFQTYCKDVLEEFLSKWYHQPSQRAWISNAFKLSRMGHIYGIGKKKFSSVLD